MSLGVGSSWGSQSDKKEEKFHDQVVIMATNWENSASELASWLQSLREGGSRATEQLWQMYFQRMVQVARRKLVGAQRLVGDEEDVALSAFKSFCLGFQQGKFLNQGSPENLWPLLVSLTLNKAIDHRRRELRLKRGGASQHTASNNPAADWSELISLEPTPEMQMIAEESFEQLLQTLDATGDDSLRKVLLHSMMGLSSQEISLQMECTVRTVQRKLQTVRALWEQTNS
jgi:RNA polymerase sigma factor (sigma-70 family)